MVDWARVAFVIGSRHRTALVRELERGPLTPSALAERLGISLSHVSQLLIGLARQELVHCLTPAAARGRLYELTPKGKEVAGELRR